MPNATLRPIRPLLLGIGLLALSACVGPLEREPDQPAPSDGSEQPSQPDPGGAAVLSLIEQSRLALQHGDYNSAIAAAERGLRIDRREPELYLVLAQSYLELGQAAQAEQFAGRGLRHTPPDSRLYQALELIKEQSSQNNGSLRF